MWLNFCFIIRNFDFLIPDAPELISNFLEGEQDMSCKRNAFMMLIHADQERALNYLSTCIDQVNSFGDILQLVIVELIYKVSLWMFSFLWGCNIKFIVSAFPINLWWTWYVIDIVCSYRHWLTIFPRGEAYNSYSTFKSLSLALSRIWIFFFF